MINVEDNKVYIDSDNGDINNQEKGPLCYFCAFPHNNENDPCACHNMEMIWFEEECAIEDYWQNQNDF